MSVLGMALAVGLAQAVGQSQATADLEAHLVEVCPAYDPVEARQGVVLSDSVAEAIEPTEEAPGPQARRNRIQRLTSVLSRVDLSVEDRAALLQARGLDRAALDEYGAAEMDLIEAVSSGALTVVEARQSLRAVGTLRWFREEYHAALTAYQRVVCDAGIEGGPKSGFYSLSTVLRELRRDEEADLWLRWLLESSNEQIARFSYQALLQQSGGYLDTAEAITLSYEMLRRWPGERRYWRDYARALSLNGHPERALQATERMQDSGLVTGLDDWRVLWSMRLRAGRGLDQTVVEIHSSVVETGASPSPHELSILYSTAAAMEPDDPALAPGLRQRTDLVIALVEQALNSPELNRAWPRSVEGIMNEFEALRQLATLLEFIGETERGRQTWQVLALARGGYQDRLNVARLSHLSGDSDAALEWLVLALRQGTGRNRRQAWELFADLAEVRGEVEVSAAARSHAGSFHDNAPTDLSIGHPPCHASTVREVVTQRAIATVYGGEFPDESWYDEVAYPQLCSSRPPLSEISLASEPDCPECSGDMLDLYWDIRRGECARLDNQHVGSPDITENCLDFYDADGNFQPNGSRPNSPPNHHN